MIVLVMAPEALVHPPPRSEVHQECWRVFYGDVCVGTIGLRAGVPTDVDQWSWSCGYFPLSHRGRRAEGTAMTFAQARAD
jgi:hypothetical protein